MYEEHLLIDGRQGSPALPFWVIAEGDVRVSDLNSTDPGLRVQNSSYWAIQNFKFDGGGKSARLNQTTGQIDRVTGVEIRQSSTAVVIHDCHVYGWTQAGISLVGSQSCIIYRCRVMDNERGEEDCHGMQVLWDCQDILVYGNTTRGNSGDGIQLQQGHENSLLPGQQPQKPPGTAPRNVTVHSNHFTGDRENGVDLKNCLRVSIQRNDFDGYTNEPAIVVHCSADEIVIERNVIHNSCGGVTVGAWNGRVGQLSFRFNKVLRLTAGLRTSGTAVRVSHTRRAEIYHNTMWQLDMNKGSGVRLADISIADTRRTANPKMPAWIPLRCLTISL
jgi:hypothetical protein